MVKDAVEAAGANTRLYTNEYNIFQFANNPDTQASDPYANWYRRNVEDINNAGFGQVVTGIGIQSIADPRTALSSNDVHSAARINQVMQNLSVSGLPITLTEFSVPSPIGFTVTPARSAQIYDESLRMMFGSPNATSFLIWEAWPSPTATPDGITTIVDSSWNLTQSGQAMVNLLNSWTTPTQNLTVGLDGTVDFTGFYGDYDVKIGSQTFRFSLAKGTQDYSLTVTPGDYNADGTVDTADYIVWRKHDGQSMTLPNRDTANSGPISTADFNSWRKNFGKTAPSGSGSGSGGGLVPEPGISALWLVAVLGNAARTQRRLRD
jgi:hypothetical protein